MFIRHISSSVTVDDDTLYISTEKIGVSGQLSNPENRLTGDDVDGEMLLGAGEETGERTSAWAQEARNELEGRLPKPDSPPAQMKKNPA